MSTDQTPIDRAAGWFRGWRPFPTGASPDDLATNEDREAAREVLSAALTNDADPDWLARVIDTAAYTHEREHVIDHASGDCVADAVRAAILGADQ